MGPAGGVSAVVRAAAWDASAQRLAVSLGAAEEPSVALFATSVSPVLTARLIGLICDEPSRQECAAGPPGAGAAAAEKLGGEEGVVGEGVVGREQGADFVRAGDVALAFQGSFAGGSLLAVRRGDAIRVLPLYYTP